MTRTSAELLTLTEEDTYSISASDLARSTLLADADLAGPRAAGGQQVERADQQASDAEFVRARLQSRFGVQVREANGSYEFYYRAGGKDNVVLRTEATQAGLDNAHQQLEQYTRKQIASLEKTFKVEFAREGEEAHKQWVPSELCVYTAGEMTYAVQPTLPQLYAVTEALKRSRPSQMTADGKDGMKIYFLDKQIIPPVYGSKPVLGVMIDEDKDGRRSLMMTPDGGRLPPTAADTTSPGQRNLAWGIVHEITHNSQTNYWPADETPREIAEQLGWFVKEEGLFGGVSASDAFLKGKNGELFALRADNCTQQTAWYEVNEEGRPKDAHGKVVKTFAEASPLTNEQVQERALMRPITYYFGNPKEMMSEALTTYRSGRAERARLFQESPALYAAAKQYDQREIARYYGVDGQGRPRAVRTPEGFIVDREPATERAIKLYEQSIGAAES